MGMAIQDSTTSDMIFLLNKRFAPEAIQEMVMLQKEFQIFAAEHGLQHSFALLGIAPAGFPERKRWYDFLDRLKTYVSDLPKVNGHDRVVKAYKDNLEGARLLPVFIDVHLSAKDARVTVSEGQPVIFTLQTYLVISIPVTPARLARQQAADAAKKRRAAKSKK
jgi:hypothetical protein